MGLHTKGEMEGLELEMRHNKRVGSWGGCSRLERMKGSSSARSRGKSQEYEKTIDRSLGYLQRKRMR